MSDKYIIDVIPSSDKQLYYIQLPKIMNKNENTNNFFKSS